jgi:Mg-chelatase subunit ChlD
MITAIILSLFLVNISIISNGGFVFATETETSETEAQQAQVYEDDLIDEQPEEPEDNETNFDIMLVLDVSGSMNRADPDRLAPMAANLFIDMFMNSNSRAGYVLFSNQINASSDFESILTLQDRTSFKNRLNRAWRIRGDTDIALGLRTAKEFILKAQEEDSPIERLPLIILLSDGNTDLPRGPRTVEESLEELEELKLEFFEMGVPIYVIGLNFDGSLDIEFLTQIATTTRARMYETDSAINLPLILFDIYADMFHSLMTQLGAFGGTGQAQSVAVPIPNDKIYEANITVFSEDGVTDIRLFDPDNNEIDIENDSNIVITYSEMYTIIKIMHPSRGDWTLSLVGADGDDIVLGLLSIYDLALRLNVTHNPLIVNENQRFDMTLTDLDKRRIDDFHLHYDITTHLNIKNLNTGTEESYELEDGITTMMVNFDMIGQYEAYVSFDGEFVIQSPVIPFVVQPIPLVLGNNYRQERLWIPFPNKFQIDPAELPISYGGEAPMLRIPQGAWTEFMEVETNHNDKSVVFTAKTIGFRPFAMVEVNTFFQDEYGQQASLMFSFNIINLYWAAGIIAFIVAIIIIKIIRR